jgi:predicted ATPase
LAAASVLSVEQINARLKDRFKLLTAGARTALPRQQTLRATLDWSFDLLAEDERAVLRRLAVFAGGFTLEAASSVASDEAIDEFAVIDLLAQLVARSLVIADTSDAGARYRLLETTQAYALEKLTEAGEVDVVRRRHAQHFGTRFERAYGDSMSDQTRRAACLLELDNVRAALDWALGADGDPAIGIALAGASGALWADSSLLAEGRQRLDSAVARVGAQTPESDQARVWLWRGILWGRAAPQDRGRSSSPILYRRLGDAPTRPHSLCRVGTQPAIVG